MHFPAGWIILVFRPPPVFARGRGMKKAPRVRCFLSYSVLLLKICGIFHTDKAILNAFCSASPIQFVLFEGQSLSRCYSNLDYSHWCSKIFHKGFHQGMLCTSKYTESVLHLWNFHIWGTHAFQSCDPRFLQILNRHHNTSICCWWIQKKKSGYFSQPVLIQYLLKWYTLKSLPESVQALAFWLFPFLLYHYPPQKSTIFRWFSMATAFT